MSAKEPELLQSNGTESLPDELVWAAGGHVSDVVLTAISSGFRDLLRSRGELSSEKLVVRTMVPVSVRSDMVLLGSVDERERDGDDDRQESPVRHGRDATPARGLRPGRHAGGGRLRCTARISCLS